MFAKTHLPDPKAVAVTAIAQVAPNQLTADSLRRMSSLLTELSVPAGTVLVAEGGLADQFMIVTSGEAQVTCLASLLPLAIIRAGEVIGEMALVENARRNATVQAITDMTVLVGTPGELASLCAMVPEFAPALEQLAHERAEANRALIAAA